MFKTFGQSLVDHRNSGLSKDEEQQTTASIAFLSTEPRAFLRENLDAHFTGSAAILDRETRSHMLMTLHAKAGTWLHLGGHCDGLPNPFITAYTEAYEESGLKSVVAATSAIFDVDVHKVTRYKDVPEHIHYDIRYLFYADMYEPLSISSESKDLEWVPISEVLKRNPEPIVRKLVDKIVQLS